MAALLKLWAVLHKNSVVASHPRQRSELSVFFVSAMLQLRSISHCDFNLWFHDINDADEHLQCIFISQLNFCEVFVQVFWTFWIGLCLSQICRRYSAYESASCIAAQQYYHNPGDTEQRTFIIWQFLWMKRLSTRLQSRCWSGLRSSGLRRGMICFRARGCQQHPVPCGLSVRGLQLLVDCCLEAALTSLPRGLPQHDNSFPRVGKGGCLLTGLWNIITHIPSPLPYFVGYR